MMESRKIYLFKKNIMYMPKYRQRKVSLSEAQLKIITDTHGILNCTELSKLPEFEGVRASKIQANKVVLGLYEPMKEKSYDFETKGMFDIKKWARVVNY